MTNRFPLRATLATLTALGTIALSGCAGTPAAPNTGIAQPRPPALARSVGQSATPLAFSATDRLQHAYIAKATVTEWRAVDERGAPAPNKAIEGGVPHVVFVYAKPQGRAYEIVRLVQLGALRWNGGDTGGTATVTAAGRTFENVRQASLVLCPAAAAEPRRADCLVAAGGSWEVQWTKGDGAVRAVPIADAGRSPGYTFWDLAQTCLAPGDFADYYGRIPVMACPKTESTWQCVQADPETLAATHTQRVEQAKQAKAEEAKRKADEDKRRYEEARRVAREKMAGAQRGSVAFCDSLSLLPSGTSISEIAFKCDLGGRDQTFGVRELMGWGWNIESETRTPERNMAGTVSYAVSLRLRKG